ncbi:serine hydrolase domain-containing protein [Klebsiella sp. I138]|uniref:serine hydrolase domain-containing protein n=1 Tax=Klebsiella sp. I138 TaxID=2755385 RepID=UPI003DAA0CA6
MYPTDKDNKTLSQFCCVMTLCIPLTGFASPATASSKTQDNIGAATDFLTLKHAQQPGTYRNVDKIFNTRTFRRGDTVSPLPAAPVQLNAVQYSPDGIHTYGIDDFMKRNNVAGLLIIKDGKIALERYAQGNTETSKWTSFSTGKSIVSTLIGAAIKDGKIKNINDQVTDYLPQMKGTAYDGVTVRQLLQMTSGVQWNEDYRDPDSDFSAMFKCVEEGKAKCIVGVMSKLPRAAAPGTQFNYKTGETHMEGEVLTAALGGESLSSYLSRKIWVPMGMESDGYWLLESKNGQEFAGGSLSMTLRDYGRFGLFILNDGVIKGQKVLPDGWVADAGEPAADSPENQQGALYSSINVPSHPSANPMGYGYNWWSFPKGQWTAWDDLDNPKVWGKDAYSQTPVKNFPNLSGAFTAEGVFGQFITINQKENVVAVVWSTWETPWIDPKEHETYSFLNAAMDKLKQ